VRFTYAFFTFAQTFVNLAKIYDEFTNKQTNKQKKMKITSGD